MGTAKNQVEKIKQLLIDCRDGKGPLSKGQYPTYDVLMAIEMIVGLTEDINGRTKTKNRSKER